MPVGVDDELGVSLDEMTSSLEDGCSSLLTYCEEASDEEGIIDELSSLGVHPAKRNDIIKMLNKTGFFMLISHQFF